MKNYELLEMTLITFTQDDVIRTSGEASDDNVGGAGDWE